MPLVLHNCRLFNGKKFLPGLAVRLDGPKIQALFPQSEISPGENTHDLGGHFLLPGLLDLQVYGADGLLFSENLNPGALGRIERALVRTGTAGFLITIPSLPFADIQQAVRAVREYLPESPGALLGLHVEGPYMNLEKRGAHRPEWVKKPEAHEVEWLLKEGRGVVRFITLAPEVVDNEVIEKFARAGIVVSAGHSSTTYERYMEGFAAGISHVTHLFNAMPPLEGRKPALLGAASDSPGVFVSIIADGQHSHFPSLRLAKKMFGERLYLITDAVTETAELRLQNGAFFNEKNILTGSALTLPKAIENCVRERVCPLGEAVRMASAYPAKVLGERGLGAVRRGARANFTVLDEAFGVKQVFLNGLAQIKEGD